MFDGWFAKKLKVGSQFGAELDNLNDIISFGVAPSILVYFWSTKYLNSLGWAVTLFFVVCAALRLARFTTDIYLSNQPIDKQKYFLGVSLGPKKFFQFGRYFSWDAVVW